MKIALAIEHFDLQQGGAEKYAWGLARFLRAAGHGVDIYAGRSGQNTDGFNVQVLPVSLSPWLSRQSRFASALKKALQRKCYDIVHGFNHVWPCDVLRLGGGVHLSFEYYNALSAGSPIGVFMRRLSHLVGPKYSALRRNERRQFDSEDRYFIAVSQKVAEDMRRYYPGAAQRICLIRNGVDTAVFNPAAAQAERSKMRDFLGVGEGTTAFLFMSNNYRLKGLAEIIEALPLVRKKLDLVVLVVGRDDARSYRRLAKSEGVDDIVRFCGYRAEPLQWYGAADVLLHPTYYDACANVCLEAMACGVAVLTTTNNGAAEVMGNLAGCQILSVPASAAQMAQAMVDLASVGRSDTVTEKLYQRAQSLSLEDNYHQVLDLYEKIVATYRRRGC